MASGVDAALNGSKLGIFFYRADSSGTTDQLSIPQRVVRAYGEARFAGNIEYIAKKCRHYYVAALANMSDITYGSTRQSKIGPLVLTDRVWGGDVIQGFYLVSGTTGCQLESGNQPHCGCKASHLCLRRAFAIVISHLAHGFKRGPRVVRSKSGNHAITHSRWNQ